MAYPVIGTGTISPHVQLNTTFRPLQAGLVNVTVSGTGIPVASGDSGSGGSAGSGSIAKKTTELLVSIELEVFRPGDTTPVFTKSGSEFLDAGAAFLWGEYPAAATDLAGDWTARVTNTGNTNAECVLTVRYQVVAGNAGKIDHIVVLMMENRSFDHMLGYLRKDGGRTDIEGLNGDEVNFDPFGVKYPVFPLKSTFFPLDPGHGLPDVNTQLCTNPPNGGFVTDFLKVIDNTPTQSTTTNDESVVLQATAHNISFLQGRAGQITLVSAPVDIPSGVQSDSGLLAKLNLFRPGSTTPVASVSADLKSSTNDLKSSTNMELTYTATAADFAVAGEWICQVSNTTDADITFQTKIVYVLAPVSPGDIMGYHTAAQVPTYDFLAREFMVCDRWFASVPTDTWPNRLYSLTGGSGTLYTTPTDASVTANPPGFSMKAIFEVLQERSVDWGVFFSDLPFSLILKQLAQDATYTARMRPVSDFLDRTKTGDLPAVSWIDPNFSDVPDGSAKANDDTPPGDITPGQAFVGQIYNALAASPAWSKTLLVVLYDEHGGFYDHVTPPGTPAEPGLPPASGGPPDDDPTLARYGVRVPAFVISPWVSPKSVSSVVHDHTSLLRTILLRFCADGGVPSMGQRTDHANELSPLLSGLTPRAGAVAPAINVTVPPAVEISVDSFGNVLRKMLLGL